MVPVEPERLRPKIDHVRERLRRLRKIEGRGRDAFLDDELLQDAAVRNLQSAIEAVLDMANHIVARGGLGTPRSYREAVEILIEQGLLPEDRGDAFRAMIGFRNRAVHPYDEVDADDVFEILESDLGDFELFIASVVRRYFDDE